MEEKSELEERLESMTIEFAARFVPYSLSRNADGSWGKPPYCLNWIVSINGHEFDYTQGYGHISEPRIKRELRINRGRMTVSLADWIADWCEKGRSYTHKQETPELADVLSSLLIDTSVITTPFEEWASDCGLDPDSRKAERIYHECRDNSLRLVHALGGMETVSELASLEH